MFMEANLDNIKWQKYLRISEEDYSGSCEVDAGTQGLHLELISLLPEGQFALDIGCGTGWSTQELSKKYISVTGISIQQAEIDFALANHLTDKTNFLLMDMHEITFLDKHFDTVYMREALEHSISPFIALCEANRVLKIDGSFIVNVPPQDWVDWHCHYFVPTEKQLKSLLDKTNFEIVKESATIYGHIYFLCKKVKDVEL